MTFLTSGDIIVKPMLGLSVVPPWMLAGRTSSISMQLEEGSLNFEETIDTLYESFRRFFAVELSTRLGTDAC